MSPPALKPRIAYSTPTVVSRGILAVVGGVVLLSAASSGFLVLGDGLSFAPPAVESVESEFGEVAANESEIRTRVVENPNGGVPLPVSIRYDVYLNDVPMAIEVTSRGASAT
jgi:LEA14-like dessication related protein